MQIGCAVTLVWIATSTLVPWAFAGDAISPINHVAVAPDLAINANGGIAVLWADRTPEMQPASEPRVPEFSYHDLYVALSMDGGVTFDPPVKVNRTLGVVRGQSVNRPRIVGTADGAWHVLYAANEIHPDLNKPAMTTHYTRLGKGETEFKPPQRIPALPDRDISAFAHIHGGFTSADAFGTIAAASDGDIHIFWIDSRDMTADSDTRALHHAFSRDGGTTFSEARSLIPSGVCPCCQLIAAATNDSDVYVGLRIVSGDNNRQSSVLRILAGGETLGGPVPTGGTAWHIEGCPLKPTAVAARGDSVFAAVYNGAEAAPGIYLSVSQDRGASFAPPVALHADAAVSDAPSIAIDNRAALIAWHGKTNGPRRIFYRFFDLAGRPLGGIESLDDAGDGGQNPVVAARPDGTFQIAWLQANRIYTASLAGPR